MPVDAPGMRPGHVGDREHDLAGADHAEVGHQRGERVVGDLGPGRGQRGDQRRLAGAREADQPDVGHGLELEHEVDDLAGEAEQGEAWGAAARRRQRGVAETAAAAGRGDEPGPGADQVGQHLAVRRGHDGAVGDRELDVAAERARAQVALPGRAGAGLAVR